MNLEILLSVMDLKIENLDNMNINSKCIVINQCKKEDYKKYKNFHIYSYNEIGISNSRNRGLEKVTEDIILFCDDDVVYNKDCEKKILEEFEKEPKADVIIFNMCSPYRKKRTIKRRKRLHIYNSLHYATWNIAFRRKSIENRNIRFNTMFGPNAKYSNGSDTMFIVDVLKNKLKIYSSPINLGTVYHRKSTWLKGYDDRFFFNKGALFTAISPRFRKILILQFLLRHKEYLGKMKYLEAYKAMIKGSNDYINDRKGYIGQNVSEKSNSEGVNEI